MFAEDLDVFFDTEEFGSTATFALPNGATVSFSVIFDDAFLNPETGLFSLETTDPQATCKMSDVMALRGALAAVNGGSPILQYQTTPLRGLPCVIDAAPGTNFAVLQVRPEGTGTATIILSVEPATVSSATETVITTESGAVITTEDGTAISY